LVIRSSVKTAALKLACQVIINTWFKRVKPQSTLN